MPQPRGEECLPSGNQPRAAVNITTINSARPEVCAELLDAQLDGAQLGAGRGELVAQRLEDDRLPPVLRWRVCP